MNTIAFDREFDVEHGVAEQLSPLIRRVVCENPSPYTFKGTNTFIVGRGDAVVIDPGPDNNAHFGALLKALDGATVSHILVTHTHMDHSPLARKLKEATGAPIHAAALATQPETAGPRLDAGIDSAFAAGVPLTDGDVIEGRGLTLQCVATPGHMSNHMCFALKEERALFSGDHVMSWSTSVIAPPDGHMGQYMASLRRLIGRGDAIYHPGHGPSRADPEPLVRAIIAHRRMREESILGHVRAGRRTLAEIVAASYPDLDPQLRPAAALSASAHLQHLIEQGLVEPGEEPDMFRAAQISP